MDGVHLNPPRYQVVDGFLLPQGFSAQKFRSALESVPRDSDVFVATYPKCGTTWTQYIVYMLLNGGRGLRRGRRLEDVFPHLEEVGADAIRALTEPRLIKTHLPWSMTPFDERARYIHIVRNPFDCAVSFFHHTRGFTQHYDFAAGDFATYFECFIEGRVDFGDYFDHLLGWYAELGRDNVLALSYEEMQQDPRAAIVLIGRFLGGQARASAEDSDCLARIVAATSFASMRRDQRRWSSQRSAGMPQFVRTGRVGDWRKTFTADQAARLAAKFVRRTRGSAAAALWPAILKAARNC